MKLALNEAGAAEFDGPQKSKRVLEQFAERQKYARKTKAPYTGPIEEVRPGDILTVERMAKYRAFMENKHNLKNIKMWGLNETWKDNGMRPFETKLPPAPEEKNPFEDL